MRSVRHFHGGRAEGGERRKFPRSSTRRSFSRRENSIPSTSVVVYYIYPDGLIAVEVFRVIGAAMLRQVLSGIGRLTLSRRERVVMIEPRECRRGSGVHFRFAGKRRRRLQPFLKTKAVTALLSYDQYVRAAPS